MNAMHSSTRSARPVRGSLEYVERKKWRELLRRLDDPAVAAELVEYMDRDATFRQSYPGIYAKAKVVLRRHAENETRAASPRAGYHGIFRAVRALFGMHDGTVEDADRRQWLRFYRSVEDPVVAEEVAGFLESDPDRLRSMPALYLQARHTLRAAGRVASPEPEPATDATAARAAIQAEELRRAVTAGDAITATDDPELFFVDDDRVALEANRLSGAA